MAKKKTNNGAYLSFEETLWAAADKLRSNMDAAEYKHVVLEQAELLARDWGDEE
jgi:type I restriction enzyme M protein